MAAQRDSRGRFVPDIESVEFTDGQCLTMAGSLGVILLTTFERNFKPMKNGTPHIVARKIKAVQEAILDLYKSTGQPIDDRYAELVCKVWDETMIRMSRGGVAWLGRKSLKRSTRKSAPSVGPNSWRSTRIRVRARRSALCCFTPAARRYSTSNTA